MCSDQSAMDHTLLISTKDLSEFLNTSEGFARILMNNLDIPKRGKGYPRLRIFAVFGFEKPYPIHAPGVWSTLLDAPAVAKETGQSEKTIGRMYEGTHKDKSFTNSLCFGPRKRMIFPFEVEAWLSGAHPKFVRKNEFMHPFLRGERPPTHYTDNPRHEPAPTGARSPATAIFLPPNAAK